MALPGVIFLDGGSKSIELSHNRIPHQRILEALQTCPQAGRGIAEIYLHEVLPIPTRTIQLLGRKCSASIRHSLLGFEVQAFYKRIHCPDMPTARYLKLFTELGCRRIRLPYDPTVTERILEELESAFAHLGNGVREIFPENRKLQVYVFQKLCGWVRHQLQAEQSFPFPAGKTNEFRAPE